MNERERLIEILRSIPPLNINIGGRRNGKHLMTMQHIADFLLANGVIIPPCKVGDTVWVVYYENKTVDKLKVESITIGKTCDTITFTDETCFTIWDKDYSIYFMFVFSTKEEAEKALAERVQK